MPTSTRESITIDKKALSRWSVITGVIIILLTGWLWWHNIYNSPKQVFWGMIANNLATESITKHVKQSTQDQSIDQFIQLQFGSSNLVHSVVTLQQSGSTVKSETIGTPKDDYSRYLSINSNQKSASGKPIDTSKVVNIWAKSATANQNDTGQYFRQGFLGIVPFANLSVDQRREAIKFIQDKN